MDTSKAQANGGVADADACDQHRPPRWYGVLIGLVAAGLGLAFGELVAGFSRALRSPVVSVGDRVIDRVPKFLEDFAKRTFGPESDKTVLRLSILVVIAIAAALVGIATVRGRRTIGSSTFGWAFFTASMKALRPAVMKAISLLSTLWCLPSSTTTRTPRSG